MTITCPAPQPILPRFELPKQNEAGSGMQKIYVHPTWVMTTYLTLYICMQRVPKSELERIPLLGREAFELPFPVGANPFPVGFTPYQ